MGIIDSNLNESSARKFGKVRGANMVRYGGGLIILSENNSIPAIPCIKYFGYAYM